MHLVRKEVNHRARFGDFGFAFDEGFERPLHQDHDLVVLVLMGIVRLHARAEDGLVHLQVKSGMLRTGEELTALFLFVAVVSYPGRMVNLRWQSPAGPWCAAALAAASAGNSIAKSLRESCIVVLSYRSRSLTRRRNRKVIG